MAMLSILGLYEYDPTIFDDMVLPSVNDLPNDPDLYIEDPEPLDTQLLIDNICMELGEMSLIYSDPDTIRKMIRIWSTMSKNTWLHLWETLLYKYNPIWNKDGTVTENETSSGTVTDSGSYTDQKSGTDTNTNYVTGFDTNSFSPNEKTEIGYGSGLTHTVNNMKSQANGQRGNVRRETGNIGVTSTQELIERQRNIVEFNMYSVITESFKSRFCVMVY